MSEFFIASHILILTLTIICIVWADTYALLWTLGKRNTLNGLILKRLHNAVTVGLIGMIITGVLLFLPLQEYLTTQSDAFFVKMFFVLALVINSFVIGKHLSIATKKSFRETSGKEKMTLFISGAISSLSWLGAIVTATQLI